MKMIRVNAKILIVITVFTVTKGITNYGREFYLSMPVVYFEDDLTTCRAANLDIASQGQGNIEIRSTFNNIHMRQTITKGVTTVNIPCGITSLGNYKAYRGIYVNSDVDVAVYASAVYSEEAATFTALPRQSLGTKYVTALYPPGDEAAYNYINIVAPEDNTAVTITDPMHTGANDTSANVNLGRLELYQISKEFDMSNITIESDKPVAVITGVTCANVPTDYKFCDPIVEQLLPVDSWSSLYIVPAIPPSKGYVMKALTTDESHSIALENFTALHVTPTQFQGFTLGNESVGVSSDVPISVVQYGPGKRFSNTKGDPFMTVVPGVEYYLNEYFFAIPALYANNYDNYFAVVVPTKDKGTLRLNGAQFQGTETERIQWSGMYPSALKKDYTVLIGTASAGFHHIYSSSIETTFGVMVYGYQDHGGYGYYAGMGVYKPNVVYKNVTVTVDASNVLSLPCGIPSGPGSTYFTWTKENSCTGTLASFTGDTYRVQHAMFGDAGVYVCNAVNGNSKLVTRFIVEVQEGGYEDRCTFDQSTLCGWSQSTTDQFDWTFQNGPTQSEDTGPDDDHTLANGQGMYLFIETSAPRVQGDVARLLSHTMPAKENACLSFWYYMYGDGIGSLKVLSVDSCTKKETQLFSVSGDKGEQWILAKVDVPRSNVTNDYTLAIEATVGPTYHGDISIDDVQISSHLCTGGGGPPIVG